jgi:hypothetical protein
MAGENQMTSLLTDGKLSGSWLKQIYQNGLLLIPSSPLNVPS